MVKEAWIQRWTWIVVAILLIANALTSFISVSEFWPITLSKEIWNFQNPEVSVYFKPAFHLLLSWIHFLPLDNESHILWARFFFGLIGCGIFFLLVHWLREFGLITSKPFQYFIVSLLLLSPLFFSQVIKIRSDILALFFTLLFLALGTAWKQPWNNKQFIVLVVVHYFLLGCTPRAFFHDLIALSFLIPYHWQSFSMGENRLKALLVFLAPLASFIVAFLPMGNSLGNLVLRYFKDSFSETGLNFDQLFLWIQTEPVLAFFILLSLILSFIGKDRKRWLLLAPFLMAFLTYLTANVKTPYLLASLLPFLLLPFLYRLSCLSLNSMSLAAILVGILTVSAFTTKRADWWTSNGQELQIIQQISKVLSENPQLTFFDGQGLLPRARQYLGYLGPDDDNALAGVSHIIQHQKPDLILYTARFQLLNSEVTSFLFQNYKPIAANLYIRNDVKASIEPFEFSTPPILIFHLSPILE